MIDITVNGLVKSFEIGKNVLDGLSFTVNTGEHIGILGHNGCGKTTLFHILTGQMDWDEGNVAIAPGKQLGLVSQIPVYPPEWRVEDVLEDAQSRLLRIRSRMEQVTQQLEQAGSGDLAAAETSEQLLREYDRLEADFRRLGGYELEATRSKVAAGLDLSPELRHRPFQSLSGGEKTRVNLARLILQDTDILLLDEPTNHLDLHATQWLEEYILHFKGTVLAISHDRWFLDTVVQRSIEIVDGKAEFYSGNYSFYVQERQRRFDEKLKQYEKDQAKIEQLTRAAEQMHLWAFMGADKLHKRAFSMEKRIEKLSHSEKPTEQKKLTVKFHEDTFNADEAVVVSGVSKSFGEKCLFRDISMKVTGQERIAIIGDNGAGKSTLVKMIMGQELPDTGLLYRGASVKAAYLPQIVEFSVSQRNMVDTMLYDCRCTPQEARDRLAAFGFRGESVFVPVQALSGGERSRLKLCMLMGGDINLLILDEPTNHLDIASREWMEDALSDYQQTLLFVSHDRYFIEKFATRIWAVGNGTLVDYRGGYRDYCQWRQRQEVYARNEKSAGKSSGNSTARKPDRPDSGKAASFTDKPAAPHKKKNNDRLLQKTEREIARLEAIQARLEEETRANASDYVKLMELEQQKAELDEQLLQLYEVWEEASE